MFGKWVELKMMIFDKSAYPRKSIFRCNITVFNFISTGFGRDCISHIDTAQILKCINRLLFGACWRTHASLKVHDKTNNKWYTYYYCKNSIYNHMSDKTFNCYKREGYRYGGVVWDGTLPSLSNYEPDKWNSISLLSFLGRVMSIYYGAQCNWVSIKTFLNTAEAMKKGYTGKVIGIDKHASEAIDDVKPYVDALGLKEFISEWNAGKRIACLNLVESKIHTRNQMQKNLGIGTVPHFYSTNALKR